MSKKDKIKAVVLLATLVLVLVNRVFEIRDLIDEHKSGKESEA